LDQSRCHPLHSFQVHCIEWDFAQQGSKRFVRCVFAIRCPAGLRIGSALGRYFVSTKVSNVIVVEGCKLFARLPSSSSAALWACALVNSEHNPSVVCLQTLTRLPLPFTSSCR
jgi:hypothetical protein